MSAVGETVDIEQHIPGFAKVPLRHGELKALLDETATEDARRTDIEDQVVVELLADGEGSLMTTEYLVRQAARRALELIFQTGVTE